MRRLVFIVLCVCCFSLVLLAEEDDILKIEASVKPQSLSRSQEGRIILKLTVQEGMTVNPQPSFSIEFSPSPAVVFSKEKYTDADLDIKIVEELGEGYLDLKNPVEIPFAVNPDAAEGEHLLVGKIHYFICSKEEGWCLKSSSEFSVSLSVK